jgi:hypothetical protein
MLPVTPVGPDGALLVVPPIVPLKLNEVMLSGAVDIEKLIGVAFPHKNEFTIDKEGVMGVHNNVICKVHPPTFRTELPSNRLNVTITSTTSLPATVSQFTILIVPKLVPFHAVVTLEQLVKLSKVTKYIAVLPMVLCPRSTNGGPLMVHCPRKSDTVIKHKRRVRDAKALAVRRIGVGFRKVFKKPMIQLFNLC